MTDLVFKVLQVFAGIGGGCLGFEQARTEYRGVRARFETVGAIDVDPGACDNLRMLCGGVEPTCLDLFDREQYTAFHGHPPPPEWREATPADIRAACKGRRPHVVFGSPPCQGLSALLGEEKAATAKYRALNALVVRWLWLVLEAWADDPPDLILLENVPRITTRGRVLLDRIQRMLAAYGYAVAETVHDCGELGDLGQSRKRFLAVARRRDTVDNALYEPEKHTMRSIGEVLGGLPLPEDPDAGPMHQLPRIQWKTWVRLALIRAGRDWRDLEERWAPDRWGVVPAKSGTARFNNVFRLVDWQKPSRAITGGTSPSAGGLSVADPRTEAEWHRGVLGVRNPGETSGTITGRSGPLNGAFSIADPSLGCTPTGATLRVVPADEPSPTVIGRATAWSSGSVQVADPRVGWGQGTHSMKLRVQDAAEPARTVTGTMDVQSGAQSVADPRLGCAPRNGTMGVMAADRPGMTVTASGDIHAGCSAVADGRPKAGHSTGWPAELGRAAKKGPIVIISDDGTWHRPLSTLDMLALQAFPTTLRGKPVVLSGRSTSRWRKWIGNAVPVDTARAIAEQMLITLTVAGRFGGLYLGECGAGIWVREEGVLRWHPTSGGRPVGDSALKAKAHAALGRQLTVNLPSTSPSKHRQTAGNPTVKAPANGRQLAVKAPANARQLAVKQPAIRPGGRARSAERPEPAVGAGV